MTVKVTTAAGNWLDGQRRQRRALRVVLRSFTSTLLVLFGASVVIYFSLHTLPGDPAVILGGTEASPEQVQRIRAEHGWDRPLIAQYLEWLRGVVNGDFGESPFTAKDVTAELVSKMQITLPLTLLALGISLIAAFAIGIIAAVYAHSLVGRVISWISQLGIAIPSFGVGIALVVLIALPSNGVIPATGFPRSGWSEPGRAMLSLLLPSLTLAIPLTAQLTRFVRSAVLEQLSQDYVVTARAQGLSRAQALWGHVLRNAWLPLVAVVALDTAGLLMGAVIVEQVFALSGVGQALVSAVSTRDITTVQGFLMVLSAVVIVLMMLANLIVSLVDPRVRVPE